MLITTPIDREINFNHIAIPKCATNAQTR